MTRHALTPTRQTIIEHAKATAKALFTLRRSGVFGILRPWRADLRETYPSIDERINELRIELIKVESDLFHLAKEMEEHHSVRRTASSRMREDARAVAQLMRPPTASVGSMYRLLQRWMDTYDETTAGEDDVSVRFEIWIRSMRDRLEVLLVNMNEVAGLLAAL